MKKLFILVIVLSLTTFSAFSQKTPPENVKKEFAKKYASAQSVKWDSEEKNEWEAEFKLDGKKMSACFDNDAKWIDSETEIAEKDLPEAVSATLRKDFAGYKIGLIEIYESPEINGFELSLKKGESSLEVIIDKSGKVVKKTDMKDEDEEEDDKK
jgi:hypothetical protein